MHALSPHRDFPSLDAKAHAVLVVELIQPEQLFERRAFVGRWLEWALVVRKGWWRCAGVDVAPSMHRRVHGLSLKSWLALSRAQIALVAK
ncbi:hypothetical protein [Myxococcus xanthus]|uniref:hypothetical protein n=1 Tax=Myxococcus xanthus TaxID=34 RepID=UPI00148D5A1F|nr:hypothetical protein [Myxococcus xanthus]